MIRRILSTVEESGLPTRGLPVARATLMRWRQRARAGKPLVQKPGPKKKGLAPREQIERAVGRLGHGSRRTRGTATLYARFKESISRRELTALVAEVRRQKKADMKRVTWNVPGVAWSIDATHYRGLKIIAVKDLASQYLFIPLVSERENGEEIATYLDLLFRAHGAPLFLKRDNGSPFNNHHVDAVLNRHGVLPLNSPPYYPRYNGAMERGIQEIKGALDKTLSMPCPDPVRKTFEKLNHQPRKNLQNRSAAECFYHPPRRIRLNLAQRKDLFRLIHLLFWRNIGETPGIGNHRQVAHLWRATVEAWLVRQGLITIRKNQKPVSTPFQKNWSQN